MRKFTKLFGLAALAAAGFFPACENPVKPGLGARVDITPPEFTLIAPGAGSFIKGNAVLFHGFASDDIKVASVSYQVESENWIAAEYISPDNTWSFPLDVSSREDGNLRIRFRVTDASGKNTVTDQLIFKIKNLPPKVEMQIPLIQDALVRQGERLSPDNPNPELSLRLASGGSLAGNINDIQGIAAGSPQIRLWPVNISLDSKGFPQSPAGDDSVRYGWQDLSLKEGDIDPATGKSKDGLGSLMFQFPLRIPRIENGRIIHTEDDEPLSVLPRYRFQIRAKDLDGAEAVYPGADTFVEIALEAETELPALELYLDDNSFDGSQMTAELQNKAHPYIDSISAMKQGPLSLRIKTSHSGNIWYTRLTYRRSDKAGERETLIWDSGPFQKDRDGNDRSFMGVGLERNGITGRPMVKYYTWRYLDDGKDFIGKDAAGNPVYGRLPTTNGSAEYIFTATAYSFTASSVSRQYVVRIDGSAPEISLNDVRGSAGYNESAKTWTLNGVVEPVIRVLDPETGINISAGGVYEEKFWLLADAANAALLDAKIESDSRYLPEFDGTALTGPDSGISIAKSGWITREFRIDTRAVADGDYSFYIFARNRTWNVSHEKYPFNIDQDSDRPKIRFAGGWESNPDGSVSNETDVNYNSALLNPLRQLNYGQGLRLRLIDDDALKLGPGTGTKLSVAITGFTINPDDTISTSGNTYSLPTAYINSLFGEQNVKEIEREIPQSELAKLLGASVLPDGLYYIAISMEDDTDINYKLTQFDAAGNPDPVPLGAASSSTQFWFSVDSEPPKIEVTEPDNGKYGPFLPNKLVFKGTVEDRGGPVPPPFSPGHRLIRDDTLYTGNDYVFPAQFTRFERDTGETGKWKYHFECEISLGDQNNQGKRGFTYLVSDSYGRTATVYRNSTIDTSPPLARIDAPPKMLTRKLDGMERENFVNGIIEFTVSASDNFVVKEGKWWLVPVSFGQPSYGDIFPDKTVHKGSGGVLDFSGGPARVRVNTKIKDDDTSISGVNADPAQVYPAGEYKLYVMAKDDAGNDSDPAVVLAQSRTIWIDQRSDLPEFQKIRPQNVEGKNSLVISGTLIDDDGFQRNQLTWQDTPNQIGYAYPPVRIRYSLDEGGVSWSDWKIVTRFEPANFDISTTLNFEYPLTAADKNAISAGGDGKRKFMVQVFDNNLNKLTIDGTRGNSIDHISIGGPDDFTINGIAVTQYEFILDTKAPSVGLIDPVVNSGDWERGKVFSFSEGNYPFLRGTVTEANLSKGRPLPDPDPNNPGLTDYYVYVKITDSANEQRFSVKAEYDAAATGASPDKVYNWEIPAGEVTTVFDALGEGEHTVTITANDESDKTTNADRRFIKDMTSPSIRYNNLNDSGLPTGWETLYQTWDGLTEAQKNAKKLELAARTKSHITDSVPVLRGSFSDDFSPVDSVFEYRIDYNGIRYFEYDGTQITANTWAQSLVSNDRTKPRIEGSDKSVQWFIPTGALKDGLHWVELRVADKVGNKTKDQALKKIYFILDRTAPKVFGITVSPSGGIYGARPLQTGVNENDPVFTLTGFILDENIRELGTFLGSESGPLSSVPFSLETTALSVPGDITTAETYINAQYPTADPGEKTRLKSLARKWTWVMNTREFNHTQLDGNGEKTLVIAGFDYSNPLLSNPQGRTNASWQFIKDADPPFIDLPNYALGSGTSTTSTTNKFLNMSSPRIQGSAADVLSKLKKLESSIERWNYAQSSPAYVPIPSETGQIILDNINQTTVNWTKELNLSDGLYRIRFRAEDKAGNECISRWLEFFLGSANPDIKLETNPQSPGYIKNFQKGGSLTIGGAGFTASSMNRIKEIKAEVLDSANIGLASTNPVVSLNPDPPLAAPDQPQTYTWSVTLTLPLDPAKDGSYKFRFTAEDYAGLTRSTEKSFTLDNTPPVLVVNDPPLEGSNTGAIVGAGKKLEVKGRTFDENGIAELYWYAGTKSQADLNDLIQSPLNSDFGWKKIDFTADTEWTPSGAVNTGEALVKAGKNPYDWKLSFRNPGHFLGQDGIGAYPLSAFVSGAGAYQELPLRFKAVDKTGNVNYFVHYLWIDTDADIPTVVINGPKNADGSVVRRGGAVPVTGTAKDNTWVNRVVYRIVRLQSSGGAPLASNALVVNESAEKADVYVNPLVDAANKDGWYFASGLTRGENAVWDFAINSAGNLDPPSGGTSHVQVQVRAFDGNSADPLSLGNISTNGKAGYIYLDIKGGAPVFLGSKINGTDYPTAFDPSKPKPLLPYKGTLTFTAKIRSETELRSVKWKDDINNALADISGAALATHQVNGAYHEYNAEIILNTAAFTLNGNPPRQIFKYGSGDYTLSLTATDSTPGSNLSAEHSFTINIDNSYPWAGAAERLTSNRNVAGSNYYFQGIVRDADMDNSGAWVKTGSLDRLILWLERSNVPVNLTGGTVPYSAITVPNVRTDTPGGVWEFGNQDIGSTSIQVPNAEGWRILITGNEPGKTWSGTDSQKTWSALLDTSKIPDGPAQLRWLVIDKAGNAVCYSERIVLRNHPPVITGIKLGTDLLNSGVLDGETELSAAYESSGFTARNRRLGFTVTSTGGTGELHYRLAYVENRTAETTIVKGEYYTIKNPGSFDWRGVGAPSALKGTTFQAAENAGAGGYDVYRLTLGGSLTPKMAHNALPDPAGNTVQDFVFSGTDFNTIGDYAAPGAGDYTVDDNNYPRFVLKVWDTLQTGLGYDAEDQQLSDLALIGLFVENTDTKAPGLRLYDFNPTTEETAGDTGIRPGPGIGALSLNRSKGGLYNKAANSRNMERSGHIEPRGTAGFTRDTLSGEVIVRGYAQDNQRIRQIQVSVDGGGSWTAILEMADGAQTWTALNGQTAFVTDEIDLTGHRAEWAWVWNTETLPAGTVLGEKIDLRVRALDFKASTPNSSPVSGVNGSTGLPNNAADYNHIQVDFAPFVTGFARASPNYTARSKQGWYVFSRGESNIVMKGYNLYRSGLNPSLKLNGGANMITGTAVREVKFTVPADATGGAIEYDSGISVGGSTKAVNNRIAANINDWNRQAWRNTKGSELWTDRLNAHVWTVGDDSSAAGNRTAINTAVSGAVGLGDNGAMTMDPNDGKLYAAWSHYGSSGVWAGANHNGFNSNSNKRVSGTGIPWDQDVYREVDISFDNYAGSLSLRYAYNFLRDYNLSEAGIYYKGYKVNGADYLGQGSIVDPDLSAAQYKNPRVTSPGTGSNAERTQTSFYDSRYGALYYARYGYERALDGGKRTSASGDNHHDGVINNAVAGTIGISSDAGLWSAIDYDSSNFPVIAYYDVKNDTIRLLYANNIDPWHNGNRWTRRYVLPENSPFRTGSGTYISMKIDRNDSNKIHLSFFNTTYNTVVYAVGTTTGAFTAVAVDTTENGAFWTDIAVDKSHKPWITYGDARMGGRDGVKIAYLDANKFTTETKDSYTNASTKGWETMHVPTTYTVNNDRLSIEAWPHFSTPGGSDGSQNWNAAVGYNSGKYRIAYFKKP